MKINWKKIIENKILISQLRLGTLFFLGFLIGIMLKSQALKATVIGYDDYRALISDEIQLKNIDKELN